jgi:hypothetical protein
MRDVSENGVLQNEANISFGFNDELGFVTPCHAAATDGGLCFFHANPNKASELGRIGGRSTRRAAAEGCEPLPTLDTAIAVRDTVARLIADVCSGKLHPSVAGGMTTLLNLQLRAIEKTDLEGQIAKLEQQLAEIEDKS